MIADVTDVDAGTFDVGTKMRMVFRVREYDKARGFRKEGDAGELNIRR